MRSRDRQRPESRQAEADDDVEFIARTRHKHHFKIAEQGQVASNKMSIYFCNNYRQISKKC